MFILKFLIFVILKIHNSRFLILSASSSSQVFYEKLVFTCFLACYSMWSSKLINSVDFKTKIQRKLSDKKGVEGKI